MIFHLDMTFAVDWAVNQALQCHRTGMDLLSRSNVFRIVIIIVIVWLPFFNFLSEIIVRMVYE